ncbi:hypothetical protein [Tomelloso virus]|uniref:Uncharacterized protein n=1 Tax=Tomelloso virus TaxID=2053981 RepID=A0A2H4T2V0_9VIRU|nr:hypothetical protein [Tomelloso virus]ATY70256.1 hypothetical protein [Tomelloso virus]
MIFPWPISCRLSASSVQWPTANGQFRQANNDKLHGILVFPTVLRTGQVQMANFDQPKPTSSNDIWFFLPYYQVFFNGQVQMANFNKPIMTRFTDSRPTCSFFHYPSANSQFQQANNDTFY